MRILIFLFIVIYFHDVHVASKSLLLDSLIDAELGVQEDVRLGPEDETNVIWKKVKSIPKPAIQEGNQSGKDDDSLLSSEMNELRTNEGFEEREKFVEDTENWDENGMHFVIDPQLSENIAKNDSKELNGSIIAKDTDPSQLSFGHVSSDIEKLSSSVLPELELGNFSETVVFNFIEFTQDSVVEQLTENVSSFELEFDGTSISEGNEITVFPSDVPISDFDFLIDSQTSKTFLLTELLSSQSVLISEEEDEEFTTLLGGEEDSALEIESFSMNEDQEINSSLPNEESTSVPQSTGNLISELESKNQLNTTDLNVMETAQTENIETLVPKCPEPGWCFFWFLAQDTCAENNHCLGSRICCKSGCSKTCIDV